MNREAYKATVQVYRRIDEMTNLETGNYGWLPEWVRINAVDTRVYRMDERVYQHMREMMEMTDYE